MTFDQFISWFKALAQVDQSLIVQAIQSRQPLTLGEVVDLCRYGFLGQLSDEGLDWIQEAIESPEFERINIAINPAAVTGELLSPVCPKCGQPMEEGFCPDVERSGILREVWHPGSPQRNFWGGTKIDQEKLLAVSVYRCTRCGYLERYARSSGSHKQSP